MAHYWVPLKQKKKVVLNITVFMMWSQFRVYVRILYCSIIARRTFAYLQWTPQLVLSIIYQLRFREIEFCLVSSPVIWWRSVEFQRIGVTGLTLLKHIYIYIYMIRSFPKISGSD